MRVCSLPYFTSKCLQMTLGVCLRLSVPFCGVFFVLFLWRELLRLIFFLDLLFFEMDLIGSSPIGRSVNVDWLLMTVLHVLYLGDLVGAVLINSVTVINIINDDLTHYPLNSHSILNGYTINSNYYYELTATTTSLTLTHNLVPTNINHPTITN